MALNRRTAVIGSAIRAPVDGSRQALEELLYDVVQEALADAGLGIDDIDGIVVASNDQFDGRAISVMMASGSVGGVDRDILSTPSAGEHAFVMGVLRVASGQYRTQLIVSWSPTEAHSLAEAQRLAADPYFHRRLPLDDLASFALQATALAAKVDGIDATAAALATAGGGEAGPDPKRWPLTGAMVSAPVTGAVALISGLFGVELEGSEAGLLAPLLCGHLIGGDRVGKATTRLAIAIRAGEPKGAAEMPVDDVAMPEPLHH